MAEPVGVSEHSGDFQRRAWDFDGWEALEGVMWVG